MLLSCRQDVSFCNLRCRSNLGNQSSADGDMPTNQTFTPARAAKQIGIPGSTLRHWSKVYAEFLSEFSNPEPGTQRAFTGNDIETLKAVAQLRANGIGQDEIIARLRENPTTPPQKPLESPVSRSVVQNDLDPSHDAIQRFLQASDVRDKLTDIDRRLERVESTRNLFIAFAAGAVVVAVIAVLVWLLMSR